MDLLVCGGKVSVCDGGSRVFGKGEVEVRGEVWGRAIFHHSNGHRMVCGHLTITVFQGEAQGVSSHTLIHSVYKPSSYTKS